MQLDLAHLVLRIEVSLRAISALVGLCRLGFPVGVLVIVVLMGGVILLVFLRGRVTLLVWCEDLRRLIELVDLAGRRGWVLTLLRWGVVGSNTSVAGRRIVLSRTSLTFAVGPDQAHGVLMAGRKSLSVLSLTDAAK